MTFLLENCSNPLFNADGSGAVTSKEGLYYVL